MKKIFIILTLAVMLATMLVGCGESTTPVSAVIVYGAHANAAVPSLTDTASEVIRRVVYSYGSVDVITVEGKPQAIDSFDIREPTKNLSNSKRESLANEQTSAILSQLQNISVSTEEVDTLAAIKLAARTLSSASGTKELLVIDSGLATAGYVDFTRGMLNASPIEVLSYLKDYNAIPNLEGVSVTWVGLGDVSGPQEELTPSNLITLKEIWQTILIEAGCISVDFEEDLPTAEVTASYLPYVSPVPIVQDDPFTKEEVLIELTEVIAEIEDSVNAEGDANSTDIEDSISFEEPLVLDERYILFKPDSDEFADPASAADTLKPIAELLMQHPSLNIVLAGTTATVGQNESCKRISLKRAEAVKTALLGFGVSEQQIVKTVGLGYDHIFHIPDTDEFGYLTPEAKKNRSVIIAAANSEAGESIIHS